jgi:SAM-dependent methyltransferase
MALSEYVLYHLAKALGRTNLAHSTDMKQALADIASYDRFRSGEATKILTALQRFGVLIKGKTVMDFGCNDGAISGEYLRAGAARVVGVDIDDRALDRARQLHTDRRLTFVRGGPDSIGIESQSVDVVVSYDVFEHVGRPLPILRELRRILASDGQLVISTTGWYSPFAPHLWSVMPVPWAHVFFSERSLLRACRKVYNASWYSPNMHDLDEHGQRLTKYVSESIPIEYLNKYLIRDFERTFRDAGFEAITFAHNPVERLFAPARGLSRIPWIREFITTGLWFVMTKRIECDQS